MASALGPVEVLVCNTGGPPLGPDPLGFAREQWEAAYRELVLSPMAMVEAAMPDMREHGFGRVVNVASSSVREPLDGLMLSNAHRAAMVTAFKTIARAGGRRRRDAEHAADRAHRDAAAGRQPRLAGRRARAGARDVPAARLGEPEEMAAAAVFLCSARAGYVTGETLAVDGGLMRSVF